MKIENSFHEGTFHFSCHKKETLLKIGSVSIRYSKLATELVPRHKAI